MTTPLRSAPIMRFATVYNCPNCNEKPAKAKPLAREGWVACPRCGQAYSPESGASVGGGKPVSKRDDNPSPIGPKEPRAPVVKPSKEGFCVACHSRTPYATIPAEGFSNAVKRQYGLRNGDYVCDNCAIEMEPSAFGV